MSWYKQSQSLDPYEAKVRINIYAVTEGEDDLVEPSNEYIIIPFKISIEHRSWGIKGIDVYVGGMIQVPITIQRWNAATNQKTEEEKIIPVDLTKINKEDNVRSGEVCTLGEIDLWLDASYNVDYTSSSLEIMR